MHFRFCRLRLVVCVDFVEWFRVGIFSHSIEALTTSMTMRHGFDQQLALQWQCFWCGNGRLICVYVRYNAGRAKKQDKMASHRTVVFRERCQWLLASRQLDYLSRETSATPRENATHTTCSVIFQYAVPTCYSTTVTSRYSPGVSNCGHCATTL